MFARVLIVHAAGREFGAGDEALAAVLPDAVIKAGPVAYYQHVLAIFKEWHVPEMVVQFARCALNEVCTRCRLVITHDGAYVILIQYSRRGGKMWKL